MMEEATFAGLDDPNIVTVAVITEEGCSIEDGEYSIYLLRSAQPLLLFGTINLIMESVEECISGGEAKLPEDGVTEIELRESGEWEDVFWHSFYVLESYQIVHRNL